MDALLTDISEADNPLNNELHPSYNNHDHTYLIICCIILIGFGVVYCLY